VLLAQAATTGGGGVSDLVATLSSFSPFFSLGIGGVLAVMLIKRIWIMPVGEFADYKAVSEDAREAAKASCERERAEAKVNADERYARMQTDLDAAREQVSELTETIIRQVVPAVTRVAGPLSELVEIKRAGQRKRGQSGD
jgi:hypothetical protein